MRLLVTIILMVWCIGLTCCTSNNRQNVENDSGQLIGVWITGLKLENSQVDEYSEVIGFVFSLNFSMESEHADEFRNIVLNSSIAGKFRSYREAKRLQSQFLKKIEWRHASYHEGSWILVKEEPHKVDRVLESGRVFSETEICDQLAGYSMGSPSLFLLPEPLEDRGIIVAVRRIPGNSMNLFMPGDCRMSIFENYQEFESANINHLYNISCYNKIGEKQGISLDDLKRLRDDSMARDR